MKNLLIICMLFGAHGGMLCAQEKASSGGGKISGMMFVDYYYNFARDVSFGSTPPLNSAMSGSVPGGTAMQAFQFRRIHFTYDYDITEEFSSRFRLEADQASTSSNGKIGVFVKDAFLRWKNVFSGSDLIVGIQPAPAYDISETALGYRSLEKTQMDLRGVVSSRDQGIALKGKLTANGSLNYWVMFANNSANSPEVDKYKRFYVHVHLKPTASVQLTVYADYKESSDIRNKYSNEVVANNMITSAVFVGYTKPGSFSVGIEGFIQSTANGYDNGVTLRSRSGIGISVFGNAHVTPELVLIGRWDFFDPNIDENSLADARNYIIGGLDWKVAKSVSVIPNILYEAYESPNSGRALDASLTGRLTFSYSY